MDIETIDNLINRVNLHFDYQFEKGFTSYQFCASKKYLIEHQYCYSVGWSLKNEVHIHPSKRTLFPGAGPIMVSKITEHIEMSASSSDFDCIKKFEFKIRGMEAYYNLEIEFDKAKLSSLKSLLSLNTPKLLQKVDINSKINITGGKKELNILKQDLTSVNVISILELKGRKIIDTI